MRLCICLVVAVLFCALNNPAGAELITYHYSGNTANNILVGNTTIEVQWTIDTSTPYTVVTANNYRYNGAIVDGYYKVGSTVYPFNPSGSTNYVIVRTDVYDINRNAYFNAVNFSFSTDNIPQAGLTPYDVTCLIFDFDTPRDTVLNLDLYQPLETMHLPANGGIDSAAFGMGALKGSTFSTVTSGDGTAIQVVPEPASAALIALGGIALLRRKRA